MRPNTDAHGGLQAPASGGMLSLYVGKVLDSRAPRSVERVGYVPPSRVAGASCWPRLFER